MAIQTKTMTVKSDTALAETTTTIRDTMTFDVSKMPNGITYKGLKAVLSFADPIQWNRASTYDSLTVVWDDASHGSYASKRPVPANIELTNEFYWLRTADLDAQVEIYRQEVREMEGRITAEIERAKSAEQKLNSDLRELIGKWNTFPTVTDMLDGNVDNDSIYFVQGRWEPNKGAGFYKISENLTENGYDVVKCKNGLFAKLIPFDVVTPEQLEPKTFTDWAPVLSYALKFARDNDIKFYAGNVYNTLTPIVFTEDDISVDIAGTINYSGEGYAVDIRNKISKYRFGKVLAPNGTAIALNQTENAYEDNVQSISVEYDKIVAANDGVLLYAGNHGVLDIELKCNISNTANNCYHSIGGISNTPGKPSYVGEIHISGGRMNGTDNGFLIEVGNGTECTGHRIHHLSAEGCGKLITLKADKGTINTVTIDNVRTAEIANNQGFITIDGNVRECDFTFAHLVILSALNINTTAYTTRGVYIHSPLNVSGSAYINYNTIYFSNEGYKLLDMTGLVESALSETSTWNLKSTNIPANFISKANGDIDLNNLTYFADNGIPLYVNHSNTGDIKVGETVLLNKDTDAPGIYALIKTNKSIKVLKMVK